MKNYQGPVFNNQKGNQSNWKNREPRFARTNQSMAFPIDKQSDNDNKERSPLLRERLEFEQPTYLNKNASEESTGRTDYQVPFKHQTIDESKWDLSPDERQSEPIYQRMTKKSSYQTYEPALEKREPLDKTDSRSSQVEENQHVSTENPERKVDQNLREIAKRMTKSQDSYLLFK